MNPKLRYNLARRALVPLAASALLALFTTGCMSNSDARLTNPRQPGPVLGNAVGAVSGAVAGNVAGAVVGVGEGFASQSIKVFDNDRRVVRQWQTVQTADGRIIQIPVEIEVDEHGLPLSNRTVIP
ncbi:hypothetical protein [Geminisphaera colitermitum]|uniref:hypothetical protein n=1 Tax=Geminisphaera colitermitum TaxID=1148786 RepID=UPI000158C965|nr:hypothetical protein [Geminisphaera colitermitum]